MIAVKILAWGLVAGVIHTLVMMVVYGNPRVARIHAAQAVSSVGDGTRRRRPHYFTLNFLGTQIEAYVMTIGYVWLHPLLPLNGMVGAMLLAVLFAALRVCAPVWAQWMEGTYSNSYLIVEIFAGVLGSIVIAFVLYLLT
ncbi:MULTISPECIES: hypothetical protein [unclassified Nocardia]|uniref:hypothetical protein n=1 Tax=unclassified Nocardia TaxID=2637762 RepID=UPI0034137FA2